MLTAEPSPVPPTRRGFPARDVAASVVALLLAGAVIAHGVSVGEALMTHLAGCATCGAPGALVSVGGPMVVALAAGFAGLALTLLRIAYRRPSWPFALATLALCALAVGVGEYASAGYLGG